MNGQFRQHPPPSDTRAAQRAAQLRSGLDWLESVDEQIEAHLLPMERAILLALRKYRDLIRQRTPK